MTLFRPVANSRLRGLRVRDLVKRCPPEHFGGLANHRYRAPSRPVGPYEGTFETIGCTVFTVCTQET